MFQRYLSLYLLWLIGLSTSVCAQRFPHFDRLQATGSGQESYSMPVRDLALIGVDVFEKDLAKWVEHFWRAEKFKAERDFFVEIALPTRNLTHVLIVLHIADTVYNADPDFEIHQRMASMMIDELKGRVARAQRFDWVVAVKTKYKGTPPTRSAEIVPQLDYLVPRIKYGQPLPTSTRSFMDTTLTVFDVLRHRMRIIEPRVRTQYAAFAAFDGLQLNKDVTFTIGKVPLYSDAFALTFTFNEVQVSKRMIDAHYRIAEEMKKTLQESLEPLLPMWVSFITMMDTSGTPFRIDMGRN